MEEILRVPWLQELDCSIADVERVTRDSDKKRFEILAETGTLWIRAVQGHSIKDVDDEQLLRRLLPNDRDLPAHCIHGTYRRHLESILQKGLLAGGGQGQVFRNHVHFTPFVPGDKRVISGMRYDCDVAIWIDLRKALRDDIPFYLSANQVLLSPGLGGKVDPKYFLRATDLRSNQEFPLIAAALASA